MTSTAEVPFGIGASTYVSGFPAYEELKTCCQQKGPIRRRLRRFAGTRMWHGRRRKELLRRTIRYLPSHFRGLGRFNQKASGGTRSVERECGTPRDVRILDCACGIGTQLFGLAGLGFRMTGCDLSDCAIGRARLEAQLRGLNVELFAADMRDLSLLPLSNFDGVICMDNSLPHLTKDGELARALTEIRGKMRGGGLFMASIRDYDKLIQERPVVQGPAFYGIVPSVVESGGSRRTARYATWTG